MNKLPRTLIIRTTITELIREILYAPVWWYSTGLKETLQRFALSITGSIKFFGLDIWVKNLFVPMYGETSIMGRIISFGVRLFMIVTRSVAVLAWVLLAIILLFLHITLPPVAVIAVFYHLVGILI